MEEILRDSKTRKNGGLKGMNKYKLISGDNDVVAWIIEGRVR